MFVSDRSKFKAVIQTNRMTGENRVFYRKRINGQLRVVSKSGEPHRPFKVVSYNCLAMVVSSLRGCVPVYLDEQVMFDDVPCEHQL